MIIVSSMKRPNRVCADSAPSTDATPQGDDGLGLAIGVTVVSVIIIFIGCNMYCCWYKSHWCFMEDNHPVSCSFHDTITT